MSHILTDFKTFLDSSPTSWHAVKEIGDRLAIREFHPLDEEEKWDLKLGKKYFVIRGGALCAFTLPEKKPTQAIILASHTDSPALKLKPMPAYQKANMTQFGVEVYGSPLLSSWLNRDLALAGRVVITDGSGRPEERLVHLDDALVFIPQLAIHLDREINEKGLHLNKQEHLNPIIGLSEDGKTPLDVMEKLLRRHISFHSLLSFELFLVPHEPARFVGFENEMLASYRIDNLTGVHAALCAIGFLEKPAQHRLQLSLFWDNEEVGSRSKEGAASPFLNNILERIGYSLKIDPEETLLLKNRSLCVSIDMAHALNPNYSKKHEPHHTPLLGKGIVIKYNADQKYASNALSAAIIIHACQLLNLPHQSYVCRSDLPCGSTIGPIVAQSTGINTVDIGCPQLSMHSIREVMAAQDYLDMVRLLTHLLQEG
ncbi:MAG: M18 family aminopeptidase [Rhabdochlamydiaceae bacterium]